MTPAIIPSPALESLATDMIAALSVPGCAYVHRTLRSRTGPLPMGRQIVYQRTPTGYRLALGDPDRRPTPEEAQALALAFGRPVATAWRPGVKYKPSRVLYLECEWSQP